MNLNSFESNIIPKFNYRDLIIFLLPVLIFSLYLFVYSPGILTTASYSQLHQIAIGKFTTAYPILHTFLVILFLKVFKSIFFLSAFQILVFSVMWMGICKYHRDDSSNSSNGFVLQFIVTLIICLIPINAVYSITLSSNILFSYALMFLCFLIKVMVDKDGQIDSKLTILMAVTLALVCGFNNYGIGIAIISLIAITYYLYKKNTPQKMFVRLVGLTMMFILLIGSFTLAYDVIGSNYDSYTNLVNIPSNDAFEDGINLESARSQFFSSTNYEPKENYENTASDNIGSSKYSLVDSYVNLFRENSILDGLFNNPILYLVLSVMLLAFIYIKIEKEGMFLVLVPVLFNTLIVLVTGFNNLYSNLLAFYLMTICAVALLFKFGMKPKDNSTLAVPKNENRYPSQQETYDYIEPQHEPAQDDYSYIEAEIDNLTLDEVNEMLGETQVEDAPKTEQPEIEQPETEQSTPAEGEDLLDQILNEIESEKNKD